MDNLGHDYRTNSAVHLKLGTINICGLSNRSRMVINKFIHSEKIDILAVQETGSTDTDTLELDNMNVISDTNKAANKGAALYASNRYTITKLDSISKMSRNLDSCWGLVVAHKKKLIVGNIYVKLNHKPAIDETIRMLKEAEKKKAELKASGIILLGDFNARHLCWGDKVTNYYGRRLSESIDSTLYSMCTSKSPTFLCANGSSFIDLAIISNNLVESVVSCKTDDEVELFSGAPTRGHVPLLITMKLNRDATSATVTEKLDLSKMKWEDWTKHIEDSIEEDRILLETEDCPYSLWNHCNQIITQATDTHGVKKKCCKHSKPYWTDSLSALSKELQAARKSYIKRNTDRNLQKLHETKEAFDTERKAACQEFLITKAKNLNSVQSQHFWKEFNKIFKKKTVQKIDPLMEGNDLLTDHREIENCLFSVFFEAKHLTNGDFDDTFFSEVNNLYEDIIIAGETDEDNLGDQSEDIYDLNRNVSMSEILKAIKSTGKSLDNCNFHPTMLQHLGNNALTLLQRIFNLCLSKHQWVWDGAEVIFLRKAGKDSYSKPGSYRPICITAYIGKLLEGIIARRLEVFIEKTNNTDPNQEGFSARKNTIRYLNRLHLGIHADKEKYLTIICLFVDFEKAFDSIWKKGMIVKLHKLGINGNVLKLINNFLFTRKVILNINGELGTIHQCADYGLPQGSVLSPVLFKIYLFDFLSELNQREDVAIYKFADDSTIKITADNSQSCIEALNYVLGCLQKWTKRNRMKINCDRNKTEVICFNTAENNKDLIPKSFKIGDKEIYRVSETKALGLTIDEDLTYKPHSEEILKSLHAKWTTLCKYSNRHWGFNLNIMLHLVKTLFISKLSYGSHIWITKDNITGINQLWYHVLKSITGAVLNINQIIAELILGVPPITIQTKINSIKHLMKLVNKPVQSDKYKEFLITNYNQETYTPKLIHSKYKDTFKFLEWKMELYPSHFTEEDKNIVSEKLYWCFFNLSEKSCSYSKVMINRYTETVLWKSALRNQFQLDGYPSSPTPCCDILPIPHNTPRKTEVILTSLLYKNNLTNSSLYKLGKVPSPLCSACNQQEETSDHILFYCDSVEEELRSSAHTNYRLGNKLCEGDPEPDIYIGLLNASRYPPFIKSCIDIIQTLDLRVSIDL